jgi:hypothetical protein
MVRTQIIIKEGQRKALEKIAKEENRSISSIIREFIDKQLRLHEEREMLKAAKLLKDDYLNDKELTVFSTLDGEEFYEKG